MATCTQAQLTLNLHTFKDMISASVSILLVYSIYGNESQSVLQERLRLTYFIYIRTITYLSHMSRLVKARIGV